VAYTYRRQEDVMGGAGRPDQRARPSPPGAESGLTAEQLEVVHRRAAAVAAVNVYRLRKRLRELQRASRGSTVEGAERLAGPEGFAQDLEPAVLLPIAELNLTAEQRQAVSQRIANLVSVSVYRDLQRARATATPCTYPGTIVTNCSSSSIEQ